MRKITLRLLTRLPTRYMTTGLILILILFIYGIVGSYFIMKLNIIDSVYYAVITMATVGYGDYLPKTPIQKIFATTLALEGVAVLAYVFNIMLTNFQNKMSKYSKGARKVRTITEMDDYFLLCGLGRVGKVVFDELTRRGQNVIVIERDEKITEKIEETKQVVVLTKDATEDELITKLAGEKCNSVIITTGDDVSNLFIVLAARERNPDAWIVSRASKLENIPRIKKAGADKIVSPELIGGKNLYFESTKPHTLKITVRHPPKVMFDEFKIIIKHKCMLETVEYHLPGIETTLTRTIRTKNFDDSKRYEKYLQDNPDHKKSVENLYENINNIHSHLISGPDKTTFDNLIDDLKDSVEIIGINLTNEEIAQITLKNLKD